MALRPFLRIPVPRDGEITSLWERQAPDAHRVCHQLE